MVLRHPPSQRLRASLILLIGLLAVLIVTWFVPSLSAASLNMLFRLRGAMPSPNDIVIVAIDDASLQRIGKWPWSRAVMADVLNKLSVAKPRAIGLDVIYAEPSDPADDLQLAAAIKRNGRVVLPAQLTQIETNANNQQAETTWLLPLPEFGAAAVGHAHASPDVDGILRSIQLSKADDRGRRLWALGLEVVRIAEQIPQSSFDEQPSALRFGRYLIPVLDQTESASAPGVTVIRSNEMLINYIGPTGSFPYYSFADVQSGAVPLTTFRDKIVLIGAAAQSMGDTRITPFISYNAGQRQSGQGMPGIEVHANVINTIRNHLWLRPTPDWFNFIVALTVMLGATAAISWLDGWRMVASLALILLSIILGSLFAFNHFALIPPLAPVLTGYLIVAPLLLLNNSITASRDLDQKLAHLAITQKGFALDKKADRFYQNSLAFLGAMLRAETVALFLRDHGRGSYRLESYYGRQPSAQKLHNVGGEVVSHPYQHRFELLIPLRESFVDWGALLVVRDGGEPFTDDEKRLIAKVADGLTNLILLTENRAQFERDQGWFHLSRNLAWKLRAVDEVTRGIIARMSFMNRVFASMTEAVLVADITGCILFANQLAATLCGEKMDDLIGKNLADFLTTQGILDAQSLRDAVNKVFTGQNFQIGFERLASDSNSEWRFCSLQLAAVVADENIDASLESAAPNRFSSHPETQRMIGFIAIISDETKRREIDRMKAETLQLVSHELRTPLTSIQGLSDVLLNFSVTSEDAQRMFGLIKSEAARLSEIINRYLDLTRLESGAHVLKLSRVSLAKLIADSCRSLEPLAAEKGIKLQSKPNDSLPRLEADEQLLRQVVNNLLSNAIKYSPAYSEITIETENDETELRLSVRDTGYGIPEEEQERIFEKFYRLPRKEDAEVVGSGLGLSLVKEIVEKHGGRVTVKSVLGQGSVFTIHLPLQQ